MPTRRNIVPVQRHLVGLAWLLLGCVWLTQSTGVAQTAASSSLSMPTAEYRADRILAMPKRGIHPAALANFHAAQGAMVLRAFEGIGGLQVLRLPKGSTIQSFVGRYEQSGLVEFAEPDYA